MKVNYLIRLDDASPYMDSVRWRRIEDILDKYDVKPLVGIIPANADPKTMISDENFAFWSWVHQWIDKGWETALHGYDHVCISDEGLRGLNPVWKRSEFAGVSLEVQKEKIRKGVAILKEHGINPKYFFAPSHTFDENTLRALQEESDIRIISDTIALKPYKRSEFVYIPQITGHCVKMPISGIYTFCFHPNSMKDSDYEALKTFLSINKNYFISFPDLDLTKAKVKGAIDSFLTYSFFLYRKFKGLK